MAYKPETAVVVCFGLNSINEVMVMDVLLGNPL